MNIKQLLNDDGSVRLDYTKLPPELTAQPNWVGWGTFHKTCLTDPARPGHIIQVTDKMPFRVSGRQTAMVDDPRTWSPFNKALLFVGKEIRGLGYVCGLDDGFVFGDIDHCVDPATGEIDADALQEIEKLNTYTELSPSGTGLRWVARGVKPGCKQKRANGSSIYEIYSRSSSVLENAIVYKRDEYGKKLKDSKKKPIPETDANGNVIQAPQPEGERYLRMTGAVLPGFEKIRECTPEIAALYAQKILDEQDVQPTQSEEHKDKAPVRTNTTTSRAKTAILAPGEIIAKCKSSRRFKEFDDLYNLADSRNPSDGDMELCGMFAYYTDDVGTIVDLFENSPRWLNQADRQAKHGGDYPLRTAEKALANRTNKWTPSVKRESSVSNVKPEASPRNTQENASVPEPQTQERAPLTVKTDDGETLSFDLGEWFLDNDGIKAVKSINRATGAITFEYASNVPVWVSHKLVNMQSGETSVVLCWNNQEHRGEASPLSASQDVTCLSSVVTSTKAQTLSDFGFPAMDTKRTTAFNRYMMDLLNRNDAIIPKRASTSQLGWYKLDKGGDKFDGFAPYDSVEWYETGESKKTFDAVRSYTDNGDVAPWREFMREYRKDKDLRFIISASLASPLIELLSELPFIVHTHGLTGSGKSVALKIASAIWADYRKYLKTMSGTPRALYQAPVTLNSLPTIVDEFQIIANSKLYNANEIVMTLCEGRERERLNKDGSPRPSRSYKSLIMTAGEQPLLDDTAGGGAFSRVLNVHIKDRELFVGHQPSEVIEFIEEHFGTVGHAWIEHLKRLSSEELHKLHETHKNIRDTIIATCDTSAKLASAGALIIVADQLASKWIFNDRDGALGTDDIKPYLTTRNAIDPANRAKEFVVGWIAKNQNNFISKTRSVDEIHGGILGKLDGDTSVYVLKDELVSALKAQNFSLEAVLPAWINDGFAITNGSKRPRADNRMAISGVGKANCYHLDLSRLALRDTDLEPDETEDNPFVTDNAKN